MEFIYIGRRSVCTFIYSISYSPNCKSSVVLNAATAIVSPWSISVALWWASTHSVFLLTRIYTPSLRFTFVSLSSLLYLFSRKFRLLLRIHCKYICISEYKYIASHKGVIGIATTNKQTNLKPFTLSACGKPQSKKKSKSVNKFDGTSEYKLERMNHRNCVFFCVSVSACVRVYTFWQKTMEKIDKRKMVHLYRLSQIALQKQSEKKTGNHSLCVYTFLYVCQHHFREVARVTRARAMKFLCQYEWRCVCVRRVCNVRV